MAGNGLSTEAWLIVAMIAGACAFTCLGAIARALEVGARRLELQREVRRLRKQHAAIQSGHATRKAA